MGVLYYRITIMGEKPSAEMQRIVYLVVCHSGQVLSASCHCSDYDVHISPGCINWKTSWDLWALTKPTSEDLSQDDPDWEKLASKLLWSIFSY